MSKIWLNVVKLYGYDIIDYNNYRTLFFDQYRNR